MSIRYQNPLIMGSSVYNASIGWQDSMGDGLYDFGYIDSFKCAADELVELMVPDLYVFPIMFCYRQYLELSLKNICYKVMNKDDYIRLVRRASHKLPELWSIVKEKMNFSDDDNSYINELVVFFDNIDRDSFSFRYPYNKSLDKRTLDGFLAQYNGELSYGNINLKAVKNNVEYYDDLIRYTYDQ